MKDEWVKLDDQVVAEIKLPITTSYQKVGEIQPTIDGGSIYIFDPKTGILGKAKINEPDAMPIAGQAKKRLDLQPGCHYVEALNLKNAVRRLRAGKIFITG